MSEAHVAVTLPSVDEGASLGLQTVSETGTAEPLLVIGTLLAETYELRALLGSGGMAEVYEAHDVRLDRRVAVKVARPGMEGALEAEGKALAAVNHSSVVEVFHSGVERGHHFLVMERVGGPSLRTYLDERLREGMLPIPVVTAFACALAEALAAVHDAGLSHRDLKPENVLLAPGERVVLTDFGLTRAEFVHGDQLISGSPNYMAPEVITNRVHRGSGHLVDLYALGIVAYEMLVGRTPFEREHWANTLKAHLADDPQDPRELRPDVPDELARVVLDLLAKDPGDRPESAQSVGWMLRGPRKSRQPAG